MPDSNFSNTSSSPYQEPIGDFLKLLTDSGVISPDHQKQAKAIAKDYLESHSDFISIHWHIDDVLEIATSRNLTISAEQALDVLNCVKSNHDANYGISWDSIDCALDSFDSK